MKDEPKWHGTSPPNDELYTKAMEELKKKEIESGSFPAARSVLEDKQANSVKILIEFFFLVNNITQILIN